MAAASQLDTSPPSATTMLAQAQASASLLQALRGRAGLDRVSKAEASRLKAALEKNECDTATLGALASAIASAGFMKCDEDDLLDAVTKVAANAKPGAVTDKPSRTSTQDFEHIVRYLPDRVWQSLRGGDPEQLCKFVADLGLRSPSEPTSQTLALTVLHQSEGMERAAAYPAASRLAFCRAFKNTFKTVAKKLSPPRAYVPQLPRDPKEFQLQFPELYEESFAAEGPAQSRITDAELQMLKATTPMRVQKGSVTSTPQVPLDIVRFGQHMAVQFQGLAQQVAELRGDGPQLTFLGPHGRRPALARSLSACRALTAEPVSPPPLPPPPFEDKADTVHLPAALPTPENIGESERLPTKATAKDQKSKKSIAEVTSEIEAALAPPNKRKPDTADIVRKRPAAASNGFGCSKCRWSDSGCKQCRSASFTGKRRSL